MKTETDIHKKMELAMQLNRLNNQLKESMGVEAYLRFMNAGQRLFAPKKQEGDFGSDDDDLKMALGSKDVFTGL